MPQKSAPKTIQSCPRCNRAGDSLGNCGEFAIGCPPPRNVDPAKDVVLACLKCKKTVAISAAELMQGRNPFHCVADSSQCQAVPIRLNSKEK